MYCPSCGSHNLPGIKFCTRCGTNLGAVTDYISGKLTDISRPDRTSYLQSELASGRRDSIKGGTLIGGGLMMMILLIIGGMPPIGAFFIVCWLFVWGTIQAAKGLSAWVGAGTELKALGSPTQSRIIPQMQPPQQVPPERQIVEPSVVYSTGSVLVPGSVTEETTRNLDEKTPVPPIET